MNSSYKILVLSGLTLLLLCTGISTSAATDLVWSTFLGGSTNDRGYDIAVDNFENVYVTGVATSSDFPVTVGAYDITHNGHYDIFVAKFNPTGSALEYSTLLGKSLDDIGEGLAVDHSGNAYATGRT